MRPFFIFIVTMHSIRRHSNSSNVQIKVGSGASSVVPTIFLDEDTCCHSSASSSISAVLSRRRISRPQSNPYVVGDVYRANSHRLRLVHISDTLEKHDRLLAQIPDGDILVHSGNFAHCRMSRKAKRRRQPDLSAQLDALNSFFEKLPHRYKIFVAGNHDLAFEKTSVMEIQSRLKGGIIYLQDNGCVIEGLKFWGTPWSYQARCATGNIAKAFSKPSFEAIYSLWLNIPQDTQVLISHMPPSENGNLYDQVVTRIRPRLSLFGHICDSHYEIKWKDNILFCNAAVATNHNTSSNGPQPIIVDYYVNCNSLDERITVLPPGATPPMPPQLAPPMMQYENHCCYCLHETIRHSYQNSHQDTQRASNRNRSIQDSIVCANHYQQHQTASFDTWPLQQIAKGTQYNSYRSKRARCILS